MTAKLDAHVTVYIPCFNVAKYLAACVEGVRRQTYLPVEIIAVDDGSTDNTAQIARELGVTLVQHGVNKGLAAARNTGVRSAKTPFVASLDADCVPTERWLETLMYEMAGSDRVAGASGVLLEHFQDTLPNKWRAAHMRQGWSMEREVNPLHLFGNNTVFRKDVLEEIGGYNEAPQYRTNNEDYYITRQMVCRGYDIVYNPRSVVWHLRYDTHYSVFRTYWRWFFLHRTRPDSLRGLLRKCGNNLEWLGRFASQDIREKKFRLLPYELVFFLYQTWFDLVYLRTGKSP